MTDEYELINESDAPVFKRPGGKRGAVANGVDDLIKNPSKVLKFPINGRTAKELRQRMYAYARSHGFAVAITQEGDFLFAKQREEKKK